MDVVSSRSFPMRAWDCTVVPAGRLPGMLLDLSQYASLSLLRSACDLLTHNNSSSVAPLSLRNMSTASRTTTRQAGCRTSSPPSAVLAHR